MSRGYPGLRPRLDPDVEDKVKTIDAKIINLRRAIEDGLSDATWADARLKELNGERVRLAEKGHRAGLLPNPR